MNFLKGRKGAADADAPPAAAAAPNLGKALVVGGGPAGALAAKVLSDRNFAVTLCESYPHPSGSVEKSHAYVISLNPRGQRALRRAGVDPLTDIGGAVAVEAYVRHTGTKKADSKVRVIRPIEPSVVFRRQKLTAGLLDLAEKSGATVRCGREFVGADLSKRVATFRDGKTGDEYKDSYDLLVGADGVKSSVRRCLEEQVEGFGPVRTEDDDMEYQVAVLPGWRDIVATGSEAEANLSPPDRSTHTWADRSANSNALAFPLEDGRSLVCVICPAGRLGGMKDRKKEGGGESYGPALSALFHDWTEQSRSDLATQLADDDNWPATGGTCVWVPSLGHAASGVVLVGDSGHGMWPSLGQGGNAALESVAVLADAVEAVCGTGTEVPSFGAGVRGTDVSDVTTGERSRLVAAEYDGLRHDDAAAAVDLTCGGIGSRRVRGVRNSTALFMAQMALVMILNKITLGLVPMPATLRVMRGDNVPYSTLKWELQCEKAALYAVFVALVGAIVSTYAY